MSSSVRGVVPMYPINPARMTPDPGRATVSLNPQRPTIPPQWWTGVLPGAVRTAANTPAGAAPGAIPIPAAPGGTCCG